MQGGNEELIRYGERPPALRRSFIVNYRGNWAVAGPDAVAAAGRVVGVVARKAGANVRHELVKRHAEFGVDSGVLEGGGAVVQIRESLGSYHEPLCTSKLYPAVKPGNTVLCDALLNAPDASELLTPSLKPT